MVSNSELGRADLAEIASVGFALFRQLAEGSASIEVAEVLGDVDLVEGFNPVQTLVPRSMDEAPRNTYSGSKKGEI
jgi:hypothetical protein